MPCDIYLQNLALLLLQVLCELPKQGACALEMQLLLDRHVLLPVTASLLDRRLVKPIAYYLQPITASFLTKKLWLAPCNLTVHRCGAAHLICQSFSGTTLRSVKEPAGRSSVHVLSAS